MRATSRRTRQAAVHVSESLRVQPGGEVAITDVTDWKKWHAGYDDPESSLARRLTVVRRRISETLLAHPVTTPMRILSLCSGDGRDLLPVLAHSDQETVSAVLVEQDTVLA
jgi:O-succinylbenzoate synthase